MKLVTFNIRCDYQQDGANNFDYRKPLIVEKIEEQKPDIICFQEVLPHVAGWLKEALKEYDVIGCGRSDRLRDEQEAIAYRRGSLNLVSMDTFWLSETPYEPGSRYKEQSICPRVCTEAVFEILDEHKLFRIFNIHLDHMGAEARRLGLSQILRKAEDAKAFTDIPVILAGDFNAEPDSEELGPISGRSDYTNITEGIGLTYHGFEPGDEPENIDYIYVRNPVTCSRVTKWEDKRGDVWLSDHYPVCAMLEL